MKFDGKDSDLPVDEFIFRVDTMAKCENVPDRKLAGGMHFLLSDSALTWYWLYKRQNRNATWQDHRRALMNEFRTRESDYEIKKRADSMRQNSSEFKLKVPRKLRNPIPKNEKLSMLKRNVKPQLRNALFYRSTRTMTEFVNVCRDFEKLSTQLGEDRPIFNCRTVNEIENVRMAGTGDYNWVDGENDYFLKSEESQDQQIAQIDADRSTFAICWNCKNIGHLFKDCRKPIAARHI